MFEIFEYDFMQRASYSNQARVHNGYHYPRSILTALRSRLNFPRFIKEFEPSIVKDFDKIYAVPRLLSKVTASQFEIFMRRIGAPIRRAPKKYENLFNKDLVKDVFLTREYAFDANILKNIMVDKLNRSAVDKQVLTKAVNVKQYNSDKIQVTLIKDNQEIKIIAGQVFNCTYSQINYINNNSNIGLIPLKHEFTEMAVIDVPDELKKLGITLMCGPFFSTMPFPPLKLHTLSHVRYTPQFTWYDEAENYINANDMFDKISRKTRLAYMIHDAQRYLPSIGKSKYIGSIWEVKTVLPLSEVDDSRPILFRKNAGLRNFHTIMGGKIDNIYDVAYEIDLMFK